MPWSPTKSFPHPLANLKNKNTEPHVANYLSYGFVACLSWQGLADVINEWRSTLDLEEVPLTEGPFLLESLKVPYTYTWSPALIPKPNDWEEHIDICGFLFRDQPNFEPPRDLHEFLQQGPPPVYIGFGSIVIDDPAAMTKLLLEAVRQSGVRAIISRGWSKLGYDSNMPDVFFLGDCPHEWLFRHVSAVVHHGGAGTTACGLLNGLPTTIVPFFGDQPFWGEMVAAAGAGPNPIPNKSLTSSNLTDAIRFCLSTEVCAAAKVVGQRMSTENGVNAAINSIHKHLSKDILRCDIMPQYPATWQYKKGKKSLKLSGAAVSLLTQTYKVKAKDVEMYEPKPIHIENRRWDPVSGTASASIGASNDLLMAVNSIWYGPLKVSREAAIAEAAGKPSGNNKAWAMAGSSAMSIPKMYGALLKSCVVDVPLAVTEGLRATPGLYGETVEDHDRITGVKSGTIVAGKTFIDGIRESSTGLITKPMEGYNSGGALGLTKGIGKGFLGGTTKAAAAFTGLVAYPVHGVYKSCYSLAHRKTKNTIMMARREEDQHNMMLLDHEKDIQLVINTFEAM